MTAHILIVEDEDALRSIIVHALQKNGYQVSEAANGTTAIAMLHQSAQQAHGYDVLVADLMLGDKSGIEVMEVACSLPNSPTVIFLTGHGSMETAIAALRTNAFDYLLKPCRITRILERVQAALAHREKQKRQQSEAAAWRKVCAVVEDVQPEARSAERSEGPEHTAATTEVNALDADQRAITIGALCIDTRRFEVWFDGQIVHLTPTEYAILVCLATRPGQIVSYEAIAHTLHGTDLQRQESYELVRRHLHNLRKKIDARYLVSVRGQGYVLSAPDYPPDGIAKEDPKEDQRR
jgi:DNA-binding response OmpR family regulator